MAWKPPAWWHGRVALREADAKPGHYYVSVRDGLRLALVLGPFTQPAPGGQYGHARALGYVRKVRRYVEERDHFGRYTYGTARLPLTEQPPSGSLNDVLLPDASFGIPKEGGSK
ncbi:MAG: hypothetical protein KatS3mg015_2492 [Fimbriimonadales bacterium]|nr:MAG: hypothetical protein KatS3mg015_2492 [Fimbriimonadales bacterium]